MIGSMFDEYTAAEQEISDKSSRCGSGAVPEVLISRVWRPKDILVG
jgi:hypothetical protein